MSDNPDPVNPLRVARQFQQSLDAVRDLLADDPDLYLDPEEATTMDRRPVDIFDVWAAELTDNETERVEMAATLRTAAAAAPPPDEYDPLAIFTDPDLYIDPEDTA